MYVGIQHLSPRVCLRSYTAPFFKTIGFHVAYPPENCIDMENPPSVDHVPEGATHLLEGK